MDKITIERIQLLHPIVREEEMQCYQESCEAIKGRALLRYAYTIRTWAEQNGLYALGRTVKNPVGYHATKKPMGNIVTWAKGGDSYHNYGLAKDIVLLIDRDGNGTYESASWETDVDFDGDGEADWREVVEINTRYGWEWGGNWNKPKQDMPHFQKTFGYSIQQLKALYLAAKVDAHNYVRISPTV